MSKELFKLPRETPLRVEVNGAKVDATFHHIDGSYSLCTLSDGRIFHLRAWTPMVEVDGRWEIAE